MTSPTFATSTGILHEPTVPGWAPSVLPHLDALLLEHAHLEKRAAGAAIQHLFRYAHLAVIQRPLSELAREELTHFELLLNHLERRGLTFEPQDSSGYAERLLSIRRPHEPDRMLDSFLCCALIEARSAERMALLAEAIADHDAALARTYRGLVACEARHQSLYVELSRSLCGAEAVAERLPEIAAHEAAVVRALPAAPRMHAPAP